jgi:hypothetical protein
MGRKQRRELYLGAEVDAALAEYARRHRDRFRTTSQAAEHLLRRALLGGMGEGTEGLLAPVIERAVREAAAGAVEGRVLPLLEAQSERLAGLLVRSGKDALSAHHLGAMILEELTGDPARARHAAEEARLRAGAGYARQAAREPTGGD